MITIIRKIYNFPLTISFKGLTSVVANIWRLLPLVVFLAGVLLVVVWAQFGWALLMSLWGVNSMTTMIMVTCLVSTAIGIVGDVLEGLAEEILPEDSKRILENVLFGFTMTGLIVFLLIRELSFDDFFMSTPLLLKLLYLHASGAATLGSCHVIIVFKRLIQALFTAIVVDMKKILSVASSCAKSARWYVVLLHGSLATGFLIVISLSLTGVIILTLFLPEFIFHFNETVYETKARQLQIQEVCKLWHVESCMAPAK